MSPMITRVLSTRAGYGLTILRIFVGIIFAAHGSQNSSAGLAVVAWRAPHNGWKASAWRRAR